MGFYWYERYEVIGGKLHVKVLAMSTFFLVLVENGTYILLFQVVGRILVRLIDFEIHTCTFIYSSFNSCVFSIETTK